MSKDTSFRAYFSKQEGVHKQSSQRNTGLDYTHYIHTVQNAEYVF
jgi:hypothetical protein